MRRYLMSTLSIAILLALGTIIIAQENEFNSNIFSLDSLDRAPYIVMMNQPSNTFRNSRNTREYQQQLKSSHIKSMIAAGVDADTDCSNHYVHTINGYSALMTQAQSEIIAEQTDVKSVIKDSLVTIETDASPQFLELTSVPNGAYINDINGEGVVIGILDSGIYPEHPSFTDDGTYPPPPTQIPSSLPCNFGNTDFNPEDLPFNCNNKILGARRCMNTYDMFVEHGYISYYSNGTFLSARDDHSHGTHVASTAAGNKNIEAFTGNPLVKVDFGEITGIAHRAHIIAYKVIGDVFGTWSDVAACIDFATIDNVDVLNFSGGGGIHTRISRAHEAAFFEAVKSGIFSVNSAGNSGSALGTITAPAGDPWLCTVAASTHDRLFAAKIRIKETFSAKKDRQKLTIFGQGIIPTSSVALTRTQWVPFVNGGSCNNLTVDLAEGKIILCKNDVFLSSSAMTQKVREVSGLGVIYWAHAVDDIANKLFLPRFIYNVDDILFAFVWFEEGQMIEDYINESYDPNNVLIKIVNKKKKFDEAPSMSTVSSRGPNRAALDIIKPDITAPGVNILAGMSPTKNNRGQSGIFKLGDLFVAISGTSMSSPHIAGIGALIKQFHPHWGPDYIKSAIMTTSYQSGIVDGDLTTEANVFDYGSGHVNPGTDFNKCSQSIINPGLVYPATENDYNSGLCENTTDLTPTPEICDALLDQGYTNLMRDINQPNIGVIPLNNMVTVRRYVVSVASGTNHFEVDIHKPKGIKVKVSPKVLKLRENERGDYTVKFSVTSSAILDEYSFGYLLWKCDIYTVYSSIVVYPSTSSN